MVGENELAIDASFSQTTSEAKVTPAVGEEVTEGVKPTLTATTTTSIFVIDKVKLAEFVTEKAKLADNMKIYEMKDPFIENFLKVEGGYTGKLKTSYATGPKLTESEVVEIIRGKGMGDAQHELKDIDGVTSVTMDPSFPWVTAVPSDTNKITVNIEIRDQNEQQNQDS